MRPDEITTPPAPDTERRDELQEFSDFSLWLRSRRRTYEAFATTTSKSERVGQSPPNVGRWTRNLIKLSGLWALVELPVELWGAQDSMEILALSLSTALWISIVFLVLRGSQLARGVFVFLCALGVLAVAPALPAEFSTFRFAFYLSLAECVVKCVLFVVFVSRYISMEA